MPRFPFTDRPRLWGTAVSHYQVEGDDACDWTEWEKAGRTRGEPCGRAVGAWDRYESDAGLARDAGANAFRFSVSWSRVEPREGHFDDAALERYGRLVDHLVAIGLEPCLTLFHYTRVGATSVSVDEQTIALADIVAQCTTKAPVLAMGGSLLHGEQEWWIGDAKETLKFRGKPEDLDRLATALTHARSEIPHGGCNDRELRRKLVRP